MIKNFVFIIIKNSAIVELGNVYKITRAVREIKNVMQG